MSFVQAVAVALMRDRLLAARTGRPRRRHPYTLARRPDGQPSALGDPCSVCGDSPRAVEHDQPDTVHVVIGSEPKAGGR